MWYCLQPILLLGTSLVRASPLQNSETAQSLMQYMWREEFLLILRKMDKLSNHHEPNEREKTHTHTHTQIYIYIYTHTHYIYTHTHTSGGAFKG